MKINNKRLREQFRTIVKVDRIGSDIVYDNNLIVRRLECKHCEYKISRDDIKNCEGHFVKYGGMRAKMIKHIHQKHLDIWIMIHDQERLRCAEL